MEKVIAESITLTTERGGWLGQIVITSDGFFSGVTDWGNFSYAWRGYGKDFKLFLISLDIIYFGSKLAGGMSYVAHSKKIDDAAETFAEKILPALQAYLKEHPGWK